MSKAKKSFKKIVKTPTQPQLNSTLSWVRHENDFANHPTPHTNSMLALSQLLLT